MIIRKRNKQLSRRYVCLYIVLISFAEEVVRCSGWWRIAPAVIMRFLVNLGKRSKKFLRWRTSLIYPKCEERDLFIRNDEKRMTNNGT